MMRIGHRNQAHLKLVTTRQSPHFFSIIIRQDEIASDGLARREEVLMVDFAMTIKTSARLLSSRGIGRVNEKHHITS